MHTYNLADTYAQTKLAALPKKQLPLHTLIKACLQSLIPIKGRLETRIINKTGGRLVLRSKYKDVWEGDRFTLAPGECACVCWAPEKPFERLGVFVDMHRLPLRLIGQSMLACTQEISFLHSPSSKTFLVSMLLEALYRLAQAFADLRKLLRTKDESRNTCDDYKLGDAKAK